VSWTEWETRVQETTERFLTWRKRSKLRKKEKQRRKNPVVDWLDAILSAVVIVLLINQFLVQAYQIPSQSMVPTLLISDRIFVNKIIYGPELVPGQVKLPGFREPRRAEVVIFENPSYIPIGPVKDILQRVIYMITLSMVDIDRDEFGRPKHHFLIKRAVGMPGDRIRMNRGEIDFLLPGEREWVSEAVLKKWLGLEYPVRRMFEPAEYVHFQKAGIGLALIDSGLPMPADTERAVNRYFQVAQGTGSSSGAVSWTQRELIDNAFIEKWRYQTFYAIKPYSHMDREQWRVLERGWYIPEGRIFPMGDNRDDSRDARYFGPVRLEKVLGRALFRYWPLTRIGGIR
jgi:signal peptidase I